MFSLIALKLLSLLFVVVLGYVCGKRDWLGTDGNASKNLSNVAFYLFVPALLFRTTARIDFSTMPWGTLALFFVPASVMMVGVYVWQRRVLKRDAALPVATPGVRAVTAMFGNSVQLGIPMAAAMFGEAGLAIHVTIVSLHALVLLTIATALTELDLARDRARRANAEAHLGRLLGSMAQKTLVHPVTLPVLVGLAWNLVGLPIWPVLDELLVLLGQAVVPLCLVLIGLSLAQFGIKGSLAGAMRLSAIKLFLFPLVVLVIGHWALGLSGLTLAVVVMAAALPTGNNAVIMAQRYDAQEAESTSTIVLSTFVFAVTAPLWLLLLRWLAP